MAWCEPVVEVCDTGDELFTVASCQNPTPDAYGCQARNSSAEAPDFLKDLLSRSSTLIGSDHRWEVAALLTEFADAFSAADDYLDKTGIVRHRMDTGGAQQIQQRARRMPKQQRAEAEAEIQKILKRGVIEQSSSPTVMVKKKDGSTCFCVEYTSLNDVTSKDSYPLPRIDDFLDVLAGSEWFSTLDLKSGYWQMEMEGKDKVKTAFTAGSGL